MKKIEVVAAIIRKGDRILATQRGYGAWKDWWEFPGGKMEPGESRQEALARECREELAVELDVGAAFMDVTHEYPDLTVHLTLFEARIRSGELTLHLRQLDGTNSHHIIEAAFKAFARALRDAVSIDPAAADAVPSTKGVLV